ncbi:hypothetical protein C7Y47_07310 [Lysinibacillus sphaericus]|uniref:Uncharacterized protein n=1 Tax=Lysinibacillus sphaericus TaxID=1421 RepID=A0A544UQH1_LYSSH|nr:hypothetical protein [Lysinibacillus sp. SDF0037]TQR36078.1 hypothetical protein C7Y47_07310 [Lysinibacillus sp. SDF0037]
MGEQKYSEHYSQLWDISNTLIEMEIALKKATYIQQEVFSEYFGKLNIRNDKETQQYVIWDYDRYDVFSQIVVDNLNVISNKLAELDQMVSVSMDAAKKEGKHFD